jgi:hypothetical protein
MKPIQTVWAWKYCVLSIVMLYPTQSLASMSMLSSERDLATHSCGDTTSASEFNFVSPAYPVSVGTDNLTCTLKIDHGCPLLKKASTCQLKIDFTELIIQPPLLGSCSFDKMFINANGKYPILCGENTGHHMYLDVKGRASTDLNIVLEKLEQHLYECPDKFGIFMPNNLEKLSPTERQSSKYPSVNLANAGNLPTASFSTRRAWKIKVEQLSCGCSTSTAAPDGCLQYYTGISGSVKSFNYDHVGCYSNDQVCDPANVGTCDLFAGFTGHLNNLDYTVCIEQEYGFCGTEYYQAMEIGSFSLTNTTDLSESSYDERIYGSANGAHCSSDYLIIPGGHCKNERNHYSSDRFCGNALGVEGLKQPIISYSKPFLFRVKTDADELTKSIDYLNRGFHMNYHQLPCSTNRL